MHKISLLIAVTLVSMLAACGKPVQTKVTGQELLTWMNEAPTSSCEVIKERQEVLGRIAKGPMEVNGKRLGAPGSSDALPMLAVALATTKALSKRYYARCATAKELEAERKICAQLPNFCRL